jgi:flagellar biosynthesis/type III secretory pathway chaperone
MEELLKKLLELFGKKEQTFQKLLTIVKREKECLVKNKTDELQSLVAMQEQMVKETAQLEQERIKLTRKIAEELKLPGTVTMTQIITAAQEPYKTDLQKAHDGMVATLEEMDGLNKINAELVKSSLDYINFSLKTFSKVTDTNPLYEGSGQIKNILKDRKIIDQEL